ncbi:hypothetical protein GCM10023081_27550 [Arthrobacter ginkgonis]|uniref:Carrier domain-containing protein n=1 Tax=Arthrobacter ginkgonis TaxID=1630594 RepID=A0ABP7CE65_9MICC
MSATATREGILAALADTAGLDLEELEPGDRLMDLGIDSIRLMALVDAWRQDGLPVDFSRLAAAEDLDEFVALVLSAG